FVYLAPHSLAEAVEMRRVHDNANFLAGGTALLVAMERGQASAETIIDLKHIRQLREIELTAEGELKIGALTTLREIIDSQLIRSYAPVLVQTAQLTATPQVRNLGTIGGNIASGLAAADLATALIALNAHVLVATNSGEVRMPLNDFLGDTKVISQQETRIISAVILSGARGHASYQKLMVRNAADV
ncbi:MAG: FAD binding domain-containing protein, partial [Anaerolineae bacterium]|nr:FAD binding domain-containing protein [Anaerolineae bacterium]